jgi:hypothetical protein
MKPQFKELTCLRYVNFIAFIYFLYTANSNKHNVRYRTGCSIITSIKIVYEAICDRMLTFKLIKIITMFYLQHYIGENRT